MGLQLAFLPLILGGLSSAIWGGYVSIRHHHSSFKQLVRDFFQIKQPLSNYLLVLIFLGRDFLPPILSGGMLIQVWYLPLCYFVKPLSLVVSKKMVGAIFSSPALPRKVNSSSVHALYLCSLVTVAYPLFLH